MIIIACLINIIIVCCEAYTLSHLHKKTDILRYYTCLQNFLTLCTSCVFCWFMLAGGECPEFVKGLRYVTTCGLAMTTFVFVTILGAGKKLSMTDEDFLPGITPKTANLLLHYVCPGLSLLSFLAFERGIVLDSGIWTTIAAVPSCGYWIVYMILSAAKLWDEPYQFTTPGQKSKIREALPFILIPVFFITISFVIWTLQ